MAMKLACEAPQKITAVASFIASLTEENAAKCNNDFTMPILLVNSTDDKFIPWEGGVAEYFSKKMEPVLSAENLANFWRNKNGCPDLPKIIHIADANTKDGSYVIIDSSQNCKDNSEVTFVKVIDGGHTWPNPNAKDRFLIRKIFGNTNKDIDSGELAWDFFSSH